MESWQDRHPQARHQREVQASSPSSLVVSPRAVHRAGAHDSLQSSLVENVKACLSHVGGQGHQQGFWTPRGQGPQDPCLGEGGISKN